MYRVIKYFEDLQDNRHPYKEGDEFPRAGLDVTEARFAELASSENAQRTPLIEQVEEPADEVEDVDYHAMTKTELLKAAEEKGVTVFPGDTKAVIIEALEA